MDFPYGTITTDIPPNFAPPEMWPEFGAIAYPPPICKREVVGGGATGMRWSLWPLTFEEHVGDTEPDLERSSKEGHLNYNRLITWKRVHRHEVPSGWHLSKKKSWRIDAFHDLTQAGDYSTRWAKDTRRNLREWRGKLLGHSYRVEEIPFNEFVASYKKSLTVKKIGAGQISNVERKYTLPQVREHMTVLGARNLHTGAVVAGTVFFYSPTHQSAVREAPFISEEARRSHAMTGVMDHWFAESKKHGARTLVFTHFWQPSEPRQWKGFSTFKSHFDLQYVAYPPLLWRFVRGKFL